ncbi:hypothetical protein [Tepidibacillus marianensis]|uniref:hypothetical protein n=1 Tax=Tepidibacillus marianensis TaxID=3131995 RepID=UPI0030D2BC20
MTDLRWKNTPMPLSLQRKSYWIGAAKKHTSHRQTNVHVHPSSASLENIWVPSEVKAYILPKGYYPAEEQYMPYIYTVNELTKFFAKTDKCRYCCECPYSHLIMPVLFRMIYMCGLRVSEVRLLKVADVDLENGILTIHHSKRITAGW